MTNVKLTQRQAEFLDHLLWKEQSYKKKRGIKWIDAIYQEHDCTGYDDFLFKLKETIVNQTGIEYSSEQQEEMNKIQSE